MSIAAVETVLKHSRARLGARLVHLSLANYANDAGEAYPSVPTLARESLLSDRAVQYALRELQTIGEITPRGRSKYGSTIYRLNLLGVQDLRGEDSAPVQNPTEGVKRASPDPLNEPLDRKTSAVTKNCSELRSEQHRDFSHVLKGMP